MKKIFLFICLILMFISCGKFDRKKYSKKDFKKLDFNKNYDFSNDVDVFNVYVWKSRI